MRLSSVKPNDIVAVDVRGHTGYCIVEEKASDGLSVRPITPGFTWRQIKPRQVTAHYARRGATRR